MEGFTVIFCICLESHSHRLLRVHHKRRNLILKNSKYLPNIHNHNCYSVNIHVIKTLHNGHEFKSFDRQKSEHAVLLRACNLEIL